MSRQLFISDLHLDAEARPATLGLFERFLEEQLRPGDSLFILGDLFEIWIGDDDDSTLAERVRKALRKCSDRGIHLFLQRGNRDFLIGRRFLNRVGASMLPARHLLPVAGEPTLLLHGDLLCSDDKAYLRWRRLAQSALARWLFNLLPLARRRGIGDRLRARSRKLNSMKASHIMDVNTGTVADFFRRHQVTRMIHGHTHRPGVHEHPLSRNASGRRYVMDQWHGDHADALVDDGRELIRIRIV